MANIKYIYFAPLFKKNIVLWWRRGNTWKGNNSPLGTTATLFFLLLFSNVTVWQPFSWSTYFKRTDKNNSKRYLRTAVVVASSVLLLPFTVFFLNIFIIELYFVDILSLYNFETKQFFLIRIKETDTKWILMLPVVLLGATAVIEM